MISGNTEFNLTYIIHKTSVTLIEISANRDIREFLLRINASDIAPLRFPAWYLPGISSNDAFILIWAGHALFSYATNSGTITKHETDDEIVDIYALDTYWCLICET